MCCVRKPLLDEMGTFWWQIGQHNIYPDHTAGWKRCKNIYSWGALQYDFLKDEMGSSDWITPRKSLSSLYLTPTEKDAKILIFVLSIGQHNIYPDHTAGWKRCKNIYSWGALQYDFLKDEMGSSDWITPRKSLSSLYLTPTEKDAKILIFVLSMSANVQTIAN